MEKVENYYADYDKKENLSFDSKVVHGALGCDPISGAVSFPIFQSATFRHRDFGVSTGYDYSRLQNPTRQELERTMAILEEGEVEPYEDRYGWQMINAGKAGSIYVTYQEVAEEIIAGAIDIAGEVADLKLGNPYISSTPEERDYIESPYSCTSTIDFADNIRSIQHAYCGAQAGDYSISNYVYRQDAELDANVRKAIEEAIVAIEAIEDFENTAQGNPLVKTAIEKVQALEEVLDDEVLPLLSK